MESKSGRNMSYNSAEMGGEDRDLSYLHSDEMSSGHGQEQRSRLEAQYDLVDPYIQVMRDDHLNQGQKNAGQGSNILQQTGEGVMSMAQGAASMAKGAAAGAANIAQGAATAMKTTLGMNTDNSSTIPTTTNRPGNPNTRI